QAGRGLVVCNPPYDVRLAADPALYRALGDALRRATPDWRASLLCGDAELARATGLRANKRYQVFNGAIECTLLVADPVAPPQRERAAAPVLSEGATMVANRLRRNLRTLKAWREREGVTCFRAYDADIPEYAAAIDVYAEADDPASTWLHVQEYAAPADIPADVARRRLNELLAAAREVFGLPRERIALKTRAIGKGGSKYATGFERRGETIVVREGDARLRVNLFDYLDTGLFLDHRPRHRAAGARRRARDDHGGAVGHLPAVVRGEPARERARRPRAPPGPGRCAAMARGRHRPVRPGVLRSADLLQLQARGRLRRAGRARRAAARRGGAAGARRGAVLLQQLPALPPRRGGGGRVCTLRGHRPGDHPPGLRPQPPHPPRLAPHPPVGAALAPRPRPRFHPRNTASQPAHCQSLSSAASLAQVPQEPPMATTNTSARVIRKLRGMPTSDGAGVKLTRVIGSPELDMLDPFLMLDEFGTDKARSEGRRVG